MPERKTFLYNPEQLGKKAKKLAREQQVTFKYGIQHPLEPILSRCRSILTEAYRQIAASVKQNKEISPAGEWLIDNFYIIQEQLVQVSEDLPQAYYKKLPKLTSGRYKGYPRVYELIQDLASFTDNVLDQENVRFFVQQYQDEEILTLGELWAIPIIIRLVLLQHLREHSVHILSERKIRDRALKWMDQHAIQQLDEPGRVVRYLSDLVDNKPRDLYKLLVELAKILQSRGMLTDQERKWFDYQFEKWDTTLEESVRYNAQQQSQVQLSVENSIVSLRNASEVNWSEFVENSSIVERTLRLDPAGIYEQMDFETRDSYRRKVEQLSERSDYSEFDVAEKVLLKAEHTPDEQGETDVQAHIGYYLLGAGARSFAGELGYTSPLPEQFRNFIYDHTSVYVLSIVLHTLVLLGIIWAAIPGFGGTTERLVLGTLVALLPALELSVSSVNRLFTLFLPPRVLPKMGFENGIPGEYRTIIVVPTLVSSPDDVKAQLEALEVRALANPEPSLRFALLSDFHDAPKEKMPSDQSIIAAAVTGVKELNDKYGDEFGDKFYFLHRERRWNPSEECWMGWERKRGKLEEFNRLLVDPNADTSYSIMEGDLFESPQRRPFKYVITLDSDTQLPPGSALKLVRTAAHPLNHPIVDEEKHIVERGYGIFQPRISIPPESAGKSRFSTIFSGNVGIDPYTTAVSDIYQDLFGEGVYTGKGLYDVEVFDSVLNRRFPDNSILSHDLLESTYIRTALVTDIEFFDDYPTSYAAYSKRSHRWIRGDWQILKWIFTRVPDWNKTEKNPISLLSKWKIFDNLRRSLNPVALLILLFSGWTFLPGSPLIWTAAAVGILAFPIYVNFSTDIFSRPPRVAWKLYVEKIRDNLKVNTYQAVSTLIVLPHQAYISMDAVFRTLWRIFVSREKLLEWTTASQVEKEKIGSLGYYFQNMWFSIVIGISAGVSVAFLDPVTMAVSYPFVLLWITAPLFVYFLDRSPDHEKNKRLDESQYRQLRLHACRTWQYFERYMNEDHSWLPPDNLQEDPPAEPVPRTSPTNIGLGLMSVQSAYDFGYITLSEWLYRLENSLDSIEKLERYRGHFYNWYSTVVGEVLSPQYISTVDSGNLAASLITLEQSVLDSLHKPWPNPEFFSGLSDIVEVVYELAEELYTGHPDEEQFETAFSSVKQLKTAFPVQAPGTLSGWLDHLTKLKHLAGEIASLDLSRARNILGDIELDLYYHWRVRPDELIQAQINEINLILKTIQTDDLEVPVSLTRLIELSNEDSDTDESLAVINWIRRARNAADRCDRLVSEMDFSFLYDEKRDLFSIGYDAERAALDKSRYDLLATEARLASFIAIAKGDVEPEHWFKLGRRLTSIQRNEILLSWGGTMFEYLMPILFMRSIEGTLLANTYKKVVEWQQEYGEKFNRPWGYSESGYNMLNLDLQYQYRAFGVPGLGLKRGLAEEYVVAPYATMLALMVRPVDSFENLERFRENGAYGPLGFYEAIDYTKSHMDDEEENFEIVRSYMAHHQGMSLLAISNVIYSNLLQNRFHSDPLVRACELLLQERIPKGIPIKEPHPIDVELEPGEKTKVRHVVEHLGQDAINQWIPRVHLLSNGEYSTFLTHTGTGGSRYKHYQLSRWESDRVQDDDGFFFYVKDLDRREFWSVGHQPVQRKADRYDIWYHAGKVQLARVDEWIESFMEVCVSPEDNIELRKLTFTNYSEEVRTLELTSYIEVVLNTPEADAAHPAFSKLFVQTEYIPEHHALIARRRPRQPDEDPLWMVHTVASHDLENLTEPLQYETDRTNFIGRGRNLKRPAAMDHRNRLSRTAGNVPDPILSLRRNVELGPGEKMQITFGLGKVGSREEAYKMADTYDNPYATDRVFELATIYGLVELDHTGITAEQAHKFQKMAGVILYDAPKYRSDRETLAKNRKQQSGLWPYGISGDLPLVILRIRETKQLKAVEELISAHGFWRVKGLDTDLLIINDHPPTYADEVQESILQQIESSTERGMLNRKGGIFVVKSDDIPDEDLTLLLTVAVMVFEGEVPEISLKKDREGEITESKEEARTLVALKADVHEEETSQPSPVGRDATREKLIFYNDYGGFKMDGREYVIYISKNPENGSYTFPPAPWVNILANEKFGCMVTERGSGYTWSQNSRENRLTSWSNDTVEDPLSEAFYIKDEDQSFYWSPVPGPVGGPDFYTVRHGFGYTEFGSTVDDIEQELMFYVPRSDPVKIMRLKIRNAGNTARNLSVYRYQEWVLGVLRSASSRYVITDYKKDLNAVLARNFYNNEFAGRVAFASVVADREVAKIEFTADRGAFIGRNGNLEKPRGVTSGESLDGPAGAGMDPCAAFRVPFTLDAGETVNLYFMLGESSGESLVENLLKKYRDPRVLDQAFGEVRSYWYKSLSNITVSTPLPEVDVLMNGWLQYQNVACRLWARSAFYQSGGAFGFRDQLQDAGAVYYMDPSMARAQILYHAAHQFREGDVLHWWHPPTDRGIRSRITDDLLWLPYMTGFYLESSGDDSILEEKVEYLKARKLNEDEHEAYLTPQPSGYRETLYEHCCRAIDRSLTKGEHGLPLMGTGDWNDGMDRVGAGGKGESVWLGFFLYDILDRFIPVCRDREDMERVDRYEQYRVELEEHLNREGWDGEWYLRAFYDDGTPLGSSTSDECRIDALAQAWSVISGVIPDNRIEDVVHAVESQLISDELGIIRLLTPPFDRGEKNPGYIKGYIPGVRENGGQYTHAALWLIKSFAELGKGDRAVDLIHMINPVNHSYNRQRADVYRVEPYVVAADIYGEPPLAGMGGWTWYTGSAGWMYRVILESILGIEIRKGKQLVIDPVISSHWDSYEVELFPIEGAETRYHITVNNDERVEKGISSLRVDGYIQQVKNGSAVIDLVDDGELHTATISLGIKEEVKKRSGQ